MLEKVNLKINHTQKYDLNGNLSTCMQTKTAWKLKHGFHELLAVWQSLWQHFSSIYSWASIKLFYKKTLHRWNIHFRQLDAVFQL